jgi:hypothetical protein
LSLESAREFAKLAIQNQVVGRQVLAAISGKNQPDAAQAVSDLAASAGYRFTAGEGYTVSQEAQAGLWSAELSEEDLDGVAGGATYTSTYTTTGAGQAAGAAAGAVAPGAGAAVGSIAGGIVNEIQNGNPNNSTATNAAIGAGNGYNDFKNTVTNVVNSIFSGW